MFKALAVLLGLAAIVAVRTEARSEAGILPERQLSQLLGFTGEAVARIDPQTLEPLPGQRIRVGPGGCAPRMGGIACWRNPSWTSSPDAQRLAVARNSVSSLQVVDAAKLRVEARIRLAGGSVGALAWLEPGRIVAIQESNGERQRLVVVDLAKRRVVARRALGGSVQRLATTERGLVLLLAPSGEIGPARLAIADARGAVRFVALDPIRAGSKLLGTGSEHRVESELPGLAVDPQGRRAFVVAPRGVAEIDLASLSVAYHELRAALAKQSSGHVRDAHWIGDDLLAVTGEDIDENGLRPTGLFFLGARDWRVDMIDAGASSFQVTGDVLLAMGGGWDATAERQVGIGFAAYGVDGKPRFRLFDGQLAFMSQAYGGRAYVGISGEEALRVVDLATGSVVGMREQALPWLLLGQGEGWWG